MAYTDLTASFTNKRRLDYQIMRQLGENDAENHLPAGTVWEFFQAAAPTGWTKQTAVSDKMCRVVSGSGGGTGGTVATATGLVLAHTHTVSSHNHSFPAHLHKMSYSVAGFDNAAAGFVCSADADDSAMGQESGAAGALRRIKNQTKTDGSGGTTGNATPDTDSSLSTLIPKYIDVIVCTKA